VTDYRQFTKLQLLAEIAQLKILFRSMVGNLYPDIVLKDIENAEYVLKNKLYKGAS